MNLRRRRATSPDTALADALRVVRDGLRSRLSLREAIERAASHAGSPFAPVGVSLRRGGALVASLRDEASAAPGDLACALLLLAVQAETGGDPAPAVDALAERLRDRAGSVREAQSITAQTRLQAHTILLLTPGFLVVLALLDPRGTWTALASPGPRFAVALGLLLQAMGAAWIRRIVRRATGTGAAVRTSARNRDEAFGFEVADAADMLALVLGSGCATTKGLELVAPAAPGAFGDALRSAAARIRAGSPVAAAVRRIGHEAGTDEAERFARTVADAGRLGLPLADDLRRLAAEIRSARSAERAEAVRRASVGVLVPLVLVILPAFVLACLVPLFWGGLAALGS
jgi:Flp pilus assembly protein TadB